MIRASILAVVVACCAVAGCAVAGCAHGHFDYAGFGPATWGGTCARGKAQSPVALVSQAGGGAPALSFMYETSELRAFDDGHTIMLPWDAGSALLVDGHVYALVQIHFHHPSEHTIDGQRWPVELHLVHRDSAGKLAVLALFAHEGAKSEWLAPLFAQLPAPDGQPRDYGVTRTAAALLPSLRSFLHYTGSLTAPPCTEGVEWLVLRTPITLDALQISTLSRRLPDNHRPLQPLGERVVQKSR
jgi:carbonic anhydrase